MSEQPVEIPLPEVEEPTSILDPVNEDVEIDIPSNPLVDGDRDYSVRLTYRVKADDPEHARTRFIAMLNEFGLNTWTYRVIDVETDDDFLVQDGVVMTPQEFAERVGDEDDEADGA